ncbi:MAG: tetratricopeptide repeat protein [Prevotellaceae bacterium]|jgi:tetratricopeptide (TPR) repeat protein|nr:tetratricopeptide repeat protein [Prevotellaceae bacterium]
MKKSLLIFVMCIFAAIAFAQKSNVKKANRESEALEKPDFYKAIDLIEPALTDSTTRDDPYTWWVAGHIYDRQIAYENDKLMNNSSPDETVKQESAYSAFDYFVKAAELEKLPNAKGKVVDKYTKKLAETLKWYYEAMLIFNFGVYQAENEDYKVAVKAFEKHLAIPDLPYVAALKGAPKKDSVYYKMKYYDAIYTELSKDTVSAIAKYESIKNKGFEENKICQLLYSLYIAKEDDANMVKILNEGIERFPNEPFYLGTMINRYVAAERNLEAIEYLNKAIERNPSNSVYYTIRGNLLSNIGSKKEALENYDRAIEIDPTKAEFWLNKGDFLYNDALYLTKTADATKDIREAELLRTQSKHKLNEAKNCLTMTVEIDEANLAAYKILRNIEFRVNAESAEYKRLADRVKQIEQGE